MGFSLSHDGLPMLSMDKPFQSIATQKSIKRNWPPTGCDKIMIAACSFSSTKPRIVTGFR